MQRRANKELAYLICLCGINNVENIVLKKDMMSEVFFILNEIKAQDFSTFWLTPSEIEIPEIPVMDTTYLVLALSVLSGVA